jgi:hypothetical protein
MTVMVLGRSSVPSSSAVATFKTVRAKPYSPGAKSGGTERDRELATRAFAGQIDVGYSAAMGKTAEAT